MSSCIPAVGTDIAKRFDVLSCNDREAAYMMSRSVYRRRGLAFSFL